MKQSGVTTFKYLALAYCQRPESRAAPRFVLFHAPAGEIVQWADVDRIERENPKGAQRPLRDMKVNKIAKFLEAGKLNTIPTAIIVALDDSAVRFDSSDPFADGECTSLEILVNGPKKPALIIDGQHRAYGAAKYSVAMPLSVVAFLGGDEAERAFQFVVINNTATRVSKDHIRALNLNFNPKRLNDRLLASAGIGLGLDDVKYEDLQVLDTSEPFRNMIAWPRNKDGFIPPNALEAAIAETRDRAGRLAIEGFERDVFLAVWLIVKRVRKAEWNRDSRLLMKVSIYAITVFILDNLITLQAMSDPPLELTDEGALEDAVERITSKIPAEFWTAEWSATELDTRSGRTLLIEAMQQIASNVSHGRPWYDGVSIIDASSLGDVSTGLKSLRAKRKNASSSKRRK